MSEAPKKILYHKKKHVFGWETEETIPYIRADIVDELVEALERCVPHVEDSFDNDHPHVIQARAALKKLEESHE